MTKAQENAAQRAEDIASVKRLVPAGATIYALERYTSKGRYLRFYAFPNGSRVSLSGFVARLSGRRQNKDGEVWFGGGGYSAADEGVTDLGFAVYGAHRVYRAEQLA